MENITPKYDKYNNIQIKSMIPAAPIIIYYRVNFYYTGIGEIGGFEEPFFLYNKIK